MVDAPLRVEPPLQDQNSGYSKRLCVYLLFDLSICFAIDANRYILVWYYCCNQLKDFQVFKKYVIQN